MKILPIEESFSSFIVLADRQYQQNVVKYSNSLHSPYLNADFSCNHTAVTIRKTSLLIFSKCNVNIFPF